MSENSYQVGGDHYASMAVQPWEALQAWQTYEQFSGYLLGTAQAYLARFNATAPGKGGRLDVEKAVHTLQKWLEVDMERTRNQQLVADCKALVVATATDRVPVDMTKVRAAIEDNETMKNLLSKAWDRITPVYLRTIAGGYNGTETAEELNFLAQFMDIKGGM